jgi:IMP dehydrogenase
MATMGQIIDGHGVPLQVVQAEETVFTALVRMAEHDVGALVVLRGEAVAGLFTERDYARKVILHDRTSREVTVGELMGEAVQVDRATGLEKAMALMASGARRVRYLVVVDGNRPVGIVSIGDLVKAQMAGQQDAIHALESYISGER